VGNAHAHVLHMYMADHQTGSHMVPVLNLIGTDAACVGVSLGMAAGHAEDKGIN